jgi:hypothetical protein
MPQSLRFEFVPVPEWPLLAWLARCRDGSDVVTVFHGPHVECTSEWFCEAAWAGPYEDGGFDQTDIVAGSGGRLRGDRVVFVSPGATVDRLQSLRTPDGHWVSNSLACLLESTGMPIDPASGRYYWFFRTVVGGLKKYARTFETERGPVQLTYFDNLVWDGHTLAVAPKPGMGKDFSTFDRYATFLRRSMHTLAENGASPFRAHRYELLSTASSGYDSSTVTVLAKEAGARQVLCFDQARRGLDDSGEPLARCLGMTPVIVERHAWMSSPLAEPAFMAADAHGGDVFFRGAESLLRGKILLTGYHGDKIWDMHTTKTSPDIVRGDQSGLSITEYRLTIGMLHAPVSFWGVRQIADVCAISHSPEMAPWDVGTDYNRPICRRIVESAGVPRDLFGNEKKATWVIMIRMKHFLSPESMENYLGWLAANRGAWLRKGRVPPLLDRRFDMLEVRMKNFAGRVAGDSAPAWRLKALRATGLARIVWRLADGPTYLRRGLFGWAMEHHRAQYRLPFPLEESVRPPARDARVPTPAWPGAARARGRASA